MGNTKLVGHEVDFVDGGKVGLLLKHSDISKSEYLTFNNLHEMKACALARPYIPLDLWGTLCTMMIETTAFHGAKNTL